MTNATRPQKQIRTFFTFKYGAEADPIYYRIVNDTEPAKIGSALYMPVPASHVILSPNTIGIKEKDVEIALPFTAGGFSERISNGAPFSKTDIVINEQMRVDNGSAWGDMKTMFIGRMTSVRRFSGGKSGVVSVFGTNSKSRLAMALGMSCNYHCGYTFGGNGCFVSLLSLRMPVTTSNIRNRRITIDDGLVSGGIKQKPTGYWKKGFIEVDGIQLAINDWEGTGSDEFILDETAPAEFDGNPDVYIYPGCDHTWQTCVNTWANTHFGGFGIGIPPYNPLTEVVV